MPGSVPFGGEEWEQVFVMDPEEKLSQVLLVQEANADVLDSMINVISGAGFIPVYLVADEEQLAKIIGESAGVIDEKSLRTWDSEDVLAVYDSLVRAHESINKLALVPESF
jgi:hypothetical protein